MSAISSALLLMIWEKLCGSSFSPSPKEKTNLSSIRQSSTAPTSPSSPRSTWPTQSNSIGNWPSRISTQFAPTCTFWKLVRKPAKGCWNSSPLLGRDDALAPAPRHLLSKHDQCYRQGRTHLGRVKQTPRNHRCSLRRCRVIAFPRLGGPHHRYERAA